MLFIDFVSLADRYPDMGAVWIALAEWSKDHSQVSYIVPHLVARDLAKIVPEELNRAFDILVEEQSYAQVYRVLNPSTLTFLPGAWESLTDVPDRIPDRWNMLIDTADAQIIPVLVKNG